MLKKSFNTTIKPTRPNAGVEAEYQRRLLFIVDELNKSVVYWLRAAYKANAPEIAQDASPAKELQKKMRSLSRRWMKNIDEGAPILAKLFADKSLKHSDFAFKRALKDAGFSVEFKMTRKMNDVYQALVNANVGLIKSIGQQYLSDVEGIVMRSVQNGRDLKQLSDDLHARYGVTRERAALIARDQNNKATSVLNLVRQHELGITEAKWVHSSAGKHPRQSHVDADGEVYEIAKGCFIDGEYIHPGELINCRCVSMPFIPGLDKKTDDDG